MSNVHSKMILLKRFITRAMYSMKIAYYESDPNDQLDEDAMNQSFIVINDNIDETAYQNQSMRNKFLLPDEIELLN